MRQLQRVAALAGLGAAVWPQNAEAWMAPNRRHASTSGSFEAPLSMLEAQWGSAYIEVPPMKVSDGAIDFFFPSVIGETEADLKDVLDHEAKVQSSDKEVELQEADLEPFGCSASGYTLDGGASGLLFAMEGVEVEQDCRGLCGQMAGCVAATYDGSLCSLYSSVQGLKEGSGSVTPPGCDESCFKRGKRLSGEGVSLGKAPTPHICQSMCQAASGCIGFSWNRESLECTSHGTEVDTESQTGYVSGPRDMCSLNVKSPNYAGDMFMGGDLSGMEGNIRITREIPSTEVCRRMCLLNPSCQWYTFNTDDKICYEKARSGPIGVAKRGDVTACRYSDSSCYLRNIEYTGAAYKDVKKSYLQECPHLCALEARCQRWTYNKTKKSCRLFDLESSKAGTYTSQPSWSGPKNGCASEPLYNAFQNVPSCSMRGVRYDGVPFAVEKTETANACQAKCQTTTGCEAFSYDMKGGVCYMHIAFAVMSKRPNYNFVSGPRQCAGCMKKGVEYNGEIIRELTTAVETEEECQLHCQAISTCAVFSYRGSFCRLIGRDATTEQSPLATSGTKHCAGDCYLQGVHSPRRDYGYVKELSGKTAEQCRDTCKADEKCTSFTHWNDKRCYLKDDESFRYLSPIEGAVTGFPTCSICMREGVRILANDSNLLWNLEAGNAEECKIRCGLMSSCTRFAFNIVTKQCSLLSGEGELVEARDYVSGPAKCLTDISCFQRDVAFTGGETVATDVTENAGLCMRWCAKEAQCTHFTFTFAEDRLSGQCTLLKGDLNVTKTKGAVSGPKRCFELLSLCEEPDVEYVGGEISNVDAEDTTQCRELCYKHPMCRLYTFTPAEKKCSLKKIEAVAGRTTKKQGKVSGSKVGCARSARGGYAYKGTSFKTIPGLPHETACRLQCEYESNCIAFTFDTEKKVCSLKARVDLVEPRDTGVIGPKRE